MITNEEKIDLFKKIVYELELNKSEEKILEAEKLNKQILKDKKEELLKLEEDYLRKVETRVKLRKDQIVSKTEQDNRDKLLNLRSEFLEDMLNSIKSKAEEIVKSNEYSSYISNKIEEVISNIDEKKLFVFYKPDDEVAKKTIEDTLTKKNLEFELSSSSDIKIGGFKVRNSDGTFEYDMSFQGLINSYYYEIGKLLYNSLRG